MNHWSLQFKSNLGLRIALGSTLTVVFVVALLIGSSLRREWVDAQLTIDANAVPLPTVALPHTQPAERSDNPTDSAADTDSSGDQLVQAEPTHPPDSSPTATGNLPPPKPRLSYDAEHGIPMAPDPREAKPVY
jgi:hypothetical protein